MNDTKTRDEMLREMQKNIANKEGNGYMNEIALPGVRTDTVNPDDIDH